MRETETYNILSRKALDNTSDGKLRYAKFMRASFNEISELLIIFSLSDIVENLSRDTGLSISHKCFYQAFLRFKKQYKGGLNTLKKPSNSVPELGLKSVGGNDTAPQDDVQIDFENKHSWMKDLNLDQRIIDMMIENDFDEEDYLENKSFFGNPLTAMRIISETSYQKNLDKSSKKYFE